MAVSKGMAKSRMSPCEFVDTFPVFLIWWHRAQHKPVDEQVEAWASEYMSQWPDLLDKQVEDYTAQGVDWRRIAKEKVFPHLGVRLPAMREAHQNLLEISGQTYLSAQRVLGFEDNPILVIYVGIGCGAGWVTRFRDAPAILFGLENIAECGWSDRESIAGLVAHETGHLVHSFWRTRHRKPMGSGPWWQLYEEGFAQYCEELIGGEEIWRQASENDDDDWLQWCRNHQGLVAAEFLRRVKSGESVSPLFGSWFDIAGKSQTGYFLGYQLMQELGTSLGLREIALLEDIEGHLGPLLEGMASVIDQSIARPGSG